MTLPFQDRTEAGKLLARRLAAYAGDPDAIVLALPRGGVPVGCQLARVLKGPLDVFLVRKLRTPGHEELAMGAIASGGVRVLNEEVIHAYGISEAVIEFVTRQAREELVRIEHAYRGDWAARQIEGRKVILVDDGIATGSTMLAAIQALKQQTPARIIVAAPVAPPSVVKELQKQADEVHCLKTPWFFQAVSNWYLDFSEVSDAEIRRQLELAAAPQEQTRG